MILNEKAKMRIRTAVRDYQTMFPEDYKGLMKAVEHSRQNLKTEFAELPDTRGGTDMRLIFEISEKLSVMIGMKLSHEEQIEFKEKENTRWFAKEFPQFAISKVV